MIKLTSDEQSTIVEFYKKLIDERVEDNKTLFEDKIPEYWERHLGDYSGKKKKDFPFKGSSDNHIPWAAFADTALESRFVAGVHSSGKIAGFEGFSAAAKAIAPKLEMAINDKIAPKMNLYDTTCNMFQGLLVEGTRFLKIYPVEMEKTVWRYEKLMKVVKGVSEFLGYNVDSSTNNLLKKKKKVKYFMPKWDDISGRDIVWEKGATSIQSAQWVAQHLHLNTYQIKKKKEWINFDKLPKDIEKTKTDETENVINEHIGDMSHESMLNYEKVSVWEIWGAYPFKTGKQDERGNDITEEKEYQFTIDIMNRIFLFGEKNKFFDKRKPLVAIPCYRIAGKIRGQSLPQRIGLLNDELDTIHNITIDNAILCNALTCLYVPNKGFNPERIKIKPGAMIKVQNLEGVIKKWDLGNPSLDLYKLQGFVIGLMEKMGLVTDYSMGQEAVERPTVRGTMALIREFNINVNFLLKNIQQGMTEAVRMTLQVLYEFMPTEGITFIGDKGENTLKREDLENIEDLKITVLADAIRAIKNIELERANILMDKLGQDQTGEVNTAAVKKNFVDKVDRAMVPEAIREPKELQKIQQMQQMIMQKTEELQAREQELVVNEGIQQAREYEEDLKEQGMPEEEIKKKLDAFRTEYMKRNQEAAEEEQK